MNFLVKPDTVFPSGTHQRFQYIEEEEWLDQRSLIQ
jgi:hypothetical protein